MADTSVEFCGVRFKNPLVAASSEVTVSSENMKRVIDAGAGGLVAKTVQDFEGFLDRKGYACATDIIGLAAKAAVSYSTMAGYPKQRAFINRDLCTDCKRCITSCFYNSIAVRNGEVHITDTCRGCGICTTVCPVAGTIVLGPPL